MSTSLVLEAFLYFQVVRFWMAPAEQSPSRTLRGRAGVPPYSQPSPIFGGSSARPHRRFDGDDEDEDARGIGGSGGGGGLLQGDWAEHLWSERPSQASRHSGSGRSGTPGTPRNEGGGGDIYHDDLDDEDYIAQFVNFIKHEKPAESDCLVQERTSRTVKEQLVDIMRDGTGDGEFNIYEDSERNAKHYGVFIDSRELLEGDMLLGHMLLRNPRMFLELFSAAMRRVEEMIRKNEPSLKCIVKANVHPRVMWLPRANRKENIALSDRATRAPYPI